MAKRNAAHSRGTRKIGTKVFKLIPGKPFAGHLSLTGHAHLQQVVSPFVPAKAQKAFGRVGYRSGSSGRGGGHRGK